MYKQHVRIYAYHVQQRRIKFWSLLYTLVLLVYKEYSIPVQYGGRVDVLWPGLGVVEQTLAPLQHLRGESVCCLQVNASND